MRSEVLSIVVFDQSYLLEAKRTFLRWRALTSRYFTLVNWTQKRLTAHDNVSDAECLAKTAERDVIGDMRPSIK